MPSVPCNKCRTGWQQTGDSWCLGCASLEVTQDCFKRRWTNPGVRAVAEEAALSCARFVRALGNLDGTLVSGGAGPPQLLLAAKSKAERPNRSRSPVRDERPPLRRVVPSHEPPPRDRGGRESGQDRGERDRDRDRRSYKEHRPRERSPTEEESEEQSEEEEPRQKDAEVKIEPREERSSRRSEAPPEPARPPSWKEAEDRRKEKKERKKKKKGKRGGKKHQRRYREETDPLRSSHRRLSSDKLELARDLDSGLERRA